MEAFFISMLFCYFRFKKNRLCGILYKANKRENEDSLEWKGRTVMVGGRAWSGDGGCLRRPATGIG